MFSDFINREITRMVCGKRLGGGESRQVYECAIDPTLVVKVEDKSGSFSNPFEWELWHKHLKDHKWAGDLFAPCVYISPCGSVLMQRWQPSRPIL